jgi:hypothetical protein
MKRIAITFAIFIFLVGTGIYITAYQNPFKLDAIKQLATNQNIYTDNEVVNQIPSYIHNGLVWDILDMPKFFAWVAIISLAVGTFVTFLHLLIDKLFFRRFFENPHLFPAIRRGAWCSLIIVGIIFLRLVDGFYWYNISSIVFLFICLEILISNLLRNRKKK